MPFELAVTDENIDVTSGVLVPFQNLPRVPKIRLYPFVELIPNLFERLFPHPRLLNSAQVPKPYCVIAIAKWCTELLKNFS